MLLRFTLLLGVLAGVLTAVNGVCEPGSEASGQCFTQEHHRDDHEDVEDFDSSSLDVQLSSALRIAENRECETGSVFCNIKCSQGKIVVKSTGCCKCTCKRGYSINDDGIQCNETSWTEWSSWGTCIPSQWGGVQQRQRICKTGESITSGRCVGMGSEGRTCSPVTASSDPQWMVQLLVTALIAVTVYKTKSFRLRKNVRDLTDDELHDILQAMAKFKEDLSSDGYLYIGKWHGWPFECPWYKRYTAHSNGHCSWHEHPMFLSWHRLITTQLEMGLHKHLKNKYLGIPYWDWLEDGWDQLPHLVNDPFIYDPILKRNMENPFYRTFLYEHPLYNNHTVYNYRIPEWKGLTLNKLMLRTIIRAMTEESYEIADTLIENPHNQIHNCLCQSTTRAGDCLYSMLTTTYSIFDPVFLLHHSQIDRLYSLYREVHLAAEDLDWTNSSIVGSYAKAGRNMTVDLVNSFEWAISPFCNSTMNTNPVTLNHGVWTVKNSLYGEQLFGFVYDNLNVGGSDWRGIVADLKAKQQSAHYGLQMPFVSIAAPHLGVINNKSTKFVSGCTVTDS